MLPPFPDPVFAWAFAAILIAITVIACYFDMRQWRIPNVLTINTLAVGLLVNLIRGGLLGHASRQTWLIADPNAFLGALDGLLFALAGFLFGFFLFFVLYFVGACGGGDLKLFAALGALVGPMGVFGLLVATVFAVLIFLALHYAGLRSVWGESGMIFKKLDITYTMTDADRKKHEKNMQIAGYQSKRKPRLFLAYSPALVLAAAMVVGWWCYKTQIETPTKAQMTGARPRPSGDRGRESGVRGQESEIGKF